MYPAAAFLSTAPSGRPHPQQRHRSTPATRCATITIVSPPRSSKRTRAQFANQQLSVFPTICKLFREHDDHHANVTTEECSAAAMSRIHAIHQNRAIHLRTAPIVMIGRQSMSAHSDDSAPPILTCDTIANTALARCIVDRIKRARLHRAAGMLRQPRPMPSKSSCHGIRPNIRGFSKYSFMALCSSMNS